MLILWFVQHNQCHTLINSKLILILFPFHNSIEIVFRCELLSGIGVYQHKDAQRNGHQL
jgi:hypothetical protein